MRQFKGGPVDGGDDNPRISKGGKIKVGGGPGEENLHKMGGGGGRAYDDVFGRTDKTFDERRSSHGQGSKKNEKRGGKLGGDMWAAYVRAEGINEIGVLASILPSGFAKENQ